MNQYINVKHVGNSGSPREKMITWLTFPLSSLELLASVIILLVFILQCHFYDSSSRSHQPHYRFSGKSCFSNKSSFKAHSAWAMLPDTVGQFAAKKTIFHSGVKGAKRSVNIGFAFAKWQETQLQQSYSFLEFCMFWLKVFCLSTPSSIYFLSSSKRLCRLRPLWPQRTAHHHHQTGSRASDFHWLVPGLGSQHVGGRPHGENPCHILNTKLQAVSQLVGPLTRPVLSYCDFVLIPIFQCQNQCCHC